MMPFRTFDKYKGIQPFSSPIQVPNWAARVRSNKTRPIPFSASTYGPFLPRVDYWSSDNLIVMSVHVRTARNQDLAFERKYELYPCKYSSPISRTPLLAQVQFRHLKSRISLAQAVIRFAKGNARSLNLTQSQSVTAQATDSVFTLYPCVTHTGIQKCTLYQVTLFPYIYRYTLCVELDSSK